MKICFIPIDNRPVCYNLAKDLVSIDEDIELFLPPRSYLGDLHKNADIAKILDWIENLPEFDSVVLSLDTIAYGGLIPSRRSNDSFDVIKHRLEILKQILVNKKIYAFSSIMRISNNNFNEEEKEYWSEYGKKIYEFSFNNENFPYLESLQNLNYENANTIPKEILDDYLTTRKRNFAINKMYIQWQKEGFFDTLIFSKDDCAIHGFNVSEARELERLGGKTKTGADEIPLTLLSRAIEKNIKIYVEYTEPDYSKSISNYEDISIDESVSGQLQLGGFERVYKKNDADIILIVNNFIEKQGELVMGWNTEPYKRDFIFPQKPYAVADVRFANGGDNIFVEQLLNELSLNNFYGYSGWNTSANSLGSLLSGIKIKWNAKKYNDIAFKKLQIIRFLDDWAYQSNVRKTIDKPCDISEFMKPYENIVSKVFRYPHLDVKYSFPWNRIFETEVNFQ